MSSPNLPILQPRLILGLQTTIKGNAQFITDDDVIYPVGSVLTIHNHNQKKQKFIRLNEKGKNVSSVVVSPNKKIIAVVESGDKPFVTLWCPITYKKKRVITLPTDKEIYAKEFVAVAFTFDSKYLICITGEIDWTLYMYKADKGRLECTARANNTNNTGYVREIACNPADSNSLVLVGDNLIRMLACTDFVWRQYGYSKGDQYSFCSVTWLSQDRILVGTVDGRLLMIESGELKNIFNAMDLPIVNLKQQEEVVEQISEGSLKSFSVPAIQPHEDARIRCLTTFPRGFTFGFLNGLIHLYEMESPNKFVKRNVYRIPDHTVIRDNDEITEGPALTQINYLAINPSQTKLIVTCNESQIYSVDLWMQDITSSPEVLFTEYGFALHNGPIVGISVCSWKPLLLTAGESDRTLKLWNYETEELELQQKYQDDVYSVAMHPTGLYALAGFSDKLRFFTIMIDEFEPTREFPVRLCRQCSFSRLGYLFTAANGNVIQVYSSITFDMMYNLKGHSGRIMDFSWTFDDKKMASCGDEGAVYEWIVNEQKRHSEIIIKHMVFNGVAIARDGKTVMFVGDDGHIREMTNSNVFRDVPVAPGGLDAIELSHLDLMLFVSGNNGTVYNIKLPLLEKAEYVEYNMHATNVTKILISYDDRYLFTASRDGNICIWKLLNTEGKAIQMDKDFVQSKDVLISRHVLEEKLIQIRNLQLRLKEMDSEYAYQLRQNDVINNLRMKEVHAGYCNAIEELKEKNEQMEADHIQEIHNINEDIKRMKIDHDSFVKDLEANYNEKLIFEYEKYMRLEDKMERMRRGYEKELDDLRKAKQESEETITNDFLEKIQEKDVLYEELVEESARKDKTHEMIKQQIEEDADREIYELRAKHNKELKEEQDLNVRIRGEISILKKKLLTSQKEIEDFKHKIYVLENEHVRFKKSIIGLEKDVDDLKKEITERDTTIQDKEKRIFELKRKNQELDKFKFILDFKIKELKSQIEPRERTIQDQRLQINDMVKELENLQRIILSLDLQLHELREKLQAADSEVRKEIDKNIEMKRALKKIKTEIYQASAYIQDGPVLAKVVMRMFHKFTKDEDFALARAEDTEVRNEFSRQRDFLERRVTSLQQQISKSTSNLSQDKVRLIDENASLIVETNKLRKCYKEEQRQKEKMEAILGLNRKYIAPKVAMEKLKKATTSADEITAKFKEKIEETDKVVDTLQQENDRLTDKILEKEQQEAILNDELNQE